MKKFVLLAVDDTRDNLFLLEQVVEAYLPECELVTARSAREALEHAEARDFDGALIDVQMPEIDGVEVCRRLKAGPKTRRLPVLLITSKESTPQLRSEGLVAGADDFISRPIDNKELVARIRVMLRLKQAERTASQARDELEARVAERTADLASTNLRLQREIAERERTEAALQRALEHARRQGAETAAVLASLEKSEKKLSRSERELSVRNRIAEAFLTLSGDEVFSAVLEIVLEALDSKHGMFGYMDEAGRLVAPSMTHDVFEQCRMENKTFTFPPQAWGKSIWGRAILEGRTLVSNSAFQVPPGHIAMNREISSPVVYQDRVIGLINVANKPGDYDQNDVELLGTICAYIAPVLHARLQRDRHESQRRQAEEALKRAHQELEDRVRERTAELLNANHQLNTEISERQRAEQALRETNALLERVFATTQMSLAYLDTGMTFIRVNRAYAEHDGHPPNYFVGKNHFQLFPHEENEAIFRRVVQTGEPAEFYAKPFSYAANPERGVSYWDWSLHPVKNEAGQVEGLLLCLVDVTQRERAEARARQHQAELAHVSRLSTMGEMGSAIAHELNQPLCAILSSAQASMRLLKATGTKGGPILEAVEQIVSQAKRAGDIIRHLREFTRRRAFHRSTVQIAEVIREAAGFVMAEARPHNITLHLDVPDDLPPVLGDTIQIEQILINLMRNGIESMEGTDEKQRRLEISVRAAQPDMIEVTVRDNGRGLPGDADRIFEPFFSTKAEGMGIGLAISRSIVEFHGGRLWATPAPEAGAIFHFVLPTGSP